MILCVALLFEARPIIDHFKMKEIRPAFWSNDHLSLIVTGTGLIRMSAKIGSVGSHFQKWLNVGIAGHKNLAIGSPHLIHQVYFENLSDYPRILFPSTLSSKTLKTVLSPQKTFLDDHLIDMEGHAFFRAASLYSTSELIHLLKIVSDNETSNFENLRKSDVSELIRSNINSIEETCHLMLSLSSPASGIDLSFYQKRLHMTKSEEVILKDLLAKAKALQVDLSDISLPSTKKFISSLKDRLKNKEIILD